MPVQRRAAATFLVDRHDRVGTELLPIVAPAAATGPDPNLIDGAHAMSLLFWALAFMTAGFIFVGESKRRGNPRVR